MSQFDPAIMPARGSMTAAPSGTAIARVLLGAIIAVAVVVRIRSLASGDVSWLMTLAERLLDGRHDSVEVNPPGAILAYVPAVWLSRVTGVSAEAMCDALVFLIAALSAGLSLRILGRAFRDRYD